MYYFTPDTIAQANQQILKLEPKVGGLFCILHCLTENIEENIIYEINAEMLCSQLSFVFDLEVKNSFDKKTSYIIFARDWANTFFDEFIKEKIDLLACSVFFLRRQEFEREYTEDEVIDIFINRFNLQQYKELWFSDKKNVTLEYNQGNVEDNQIKFYSKINYEIKDGHKSIAFGKSMSSEASNLTSAGHIQTLYTSLGIQRCLLYSYRPLDQYYNISNSKVNAMKAETLGSFPHNRIIFGAPGTGKSYKLNEDKDTLLKNGGGYERVTFHPDYSYANFVGTYKPVPDKDNPKDITYEYVPGPFMRVLVDALNDPDHDYVLIIEEINRANAAAVFGDVFQLLDRDECNESAYPVQTSEDMQTYLKGKLNDKAKEKLNNEAPNCKMLIIPSNMSIWATMNSADQSVYPMDTAFKRRWDFEYIDVNANEDKIKNATFKYFTGLNGVDKQEKISWNKLRQNINKVLTEYGLDEDKLLGPFFISKSNILDKDDCNLFWRTFDNKVLMYLCDDALRHRGNYQALFNPIDGHTHLSYAWVHKKFEKNGLDIFHEDVLKNISADENENQPDAPENEE